MPLTVIISVSDNEEETDNEEVERAVENSDDSQSGEQKP